MYAESGDFSGQPYPQQPQQSIQTQIRELFNDAVLAFPDHSLDDSSRLILEAVRWANYPNKLVIKEIPDFPLSAYTFHEAPLLDVRLNRRRGHIVPSIMVNKTFVPDITVPLNATALCDNFEVEIPRLATLLHGITSDRRGYAMDIRGTHEIAIDRQLAYIQYLQGSGVDTYDVLLTTDREELIQASMGAHYTLPCDFKNFENAASVPSGEALVGKEFAELVLYRKGQTATIRRRLYDAFLYSRERIIPTILAQEYGKERAEIENQIRRDMGEDADGFIIANGEDIEKRARRNFVGKSETERRVIAARTLLIPVASTYATLISETN